MAYPLITRISVLAVAFVCVPFFCCNTGKAGEYADYAGADIEDMPDPSGTGCQGMPDPSGTGGQGMPGPSGTGGQGMPNPSGGTGGQGMPSGGTGGQGMPNPSGGTGGQGMPSGGTGGQGMPDPSGTGGQGMPDPSGTGGQGMPDPSGTCGQGMPDPTEVVAKALLCFNDRNIYRHCEESCRLTRSGNLRVSPEDVDAYCSGPCLSETHLVLDCIEGIMKNFEFYNKATADDVRETIQAGCGVGNERGNFDVSEHINSGKSSAYRIMKPVTMAFVFMIVGRAVWL